MHVLEVRLTPFDPSDSHSLQITNSLTASPQTDGKGIPLPFKIRAHRRLAFIPTKCFQQD